MRFELRGLCNSRRCCGHPVLLLAGLWATVALFAITILLAGSVSSARAASEESAQTPGLEEALKGSVVVRAGASQGSGFLLGDSGCLLTAAHVTGSATTVTVVYGGAVHEAKRIAVDDERDLALFRLMLSVPCSGLLLAGLDQVQVGMDVYVIGTPMGQEGTVTKGIVSAVDRVEGGVKLIQVDAAVNPGSSGGPIVDSEGRVIALTTEMMADAQSIGYGVAGGEIRDFLAEADFSVSSIGEITCNIVPIAEDAVPTSEEDVANSPASSAWTQYWWLLLFGAGAGIAIASTGLLMFFHFRQPKPLLAPEEGVPITLAEPAAIGTRSAEERIDDAVPSEDVAGLDITFQDSPEE